MPGPEKVPPAAVQVCWRVWVTLWSASAEPAGTTVKAAVSTAGDVRRRRMGMRLRDRWLVGDFPTPPCVITGERSFTWSGPV